MGQGSLKCRFIIIILLFIQITVKNTLLAQDNQVLSSLEINKISSIDFNEENTAELEILKKSIGNARIVMLGEPDHMDGTALNAKNKVIKYLHEEMGFDVLITEDNICTSYLMDTYLTTSCNDLDSCIFFINSIQSYVQPEKQMYQYIKNEKNHLRDFSVAGLDIQVNRYNALRAMNEYIIKQLQNNIQEQKDLQDIIKFLENKDSIKIEEHELPVRIKSIELACKLLEKQIKIKDKESLIMIQSIRNLPIILYYHFLLQGLESDYEYPDKYTIRDKQMAANAIYLIDWLYKGKKVIISTSTYHIIRNHEKMKLSTQKWEEAVPMGHYLYDRYKDSLYSIAFIGYMGVIGLDYEDTVNISVFDNEIISEETGNVFLYQKYTKEAGGFEEYFYKKGYEFAYIPFKNNSSNTHIKGVFSMKPIVSEKFKSVSQNWSDVFDGIFYYKESKVVSKSSILHYRK